jgi:glutathione S-transferase
MLTVHHLSDSRSQRILWMLEELDADYDIVRYERDPGTNFAPPALKTIHPLGKAPVVVDDGLVLTESGAIVDYLAVEYDGLRPPGPAERRRAAFWVHFAEASAMTPLVLKLWSNRIADDRLRRRADEQTADILAFAAAELADAPFFAGGELSEADIMMSFPLELAAALTGFDAYPALRDYLSRIHARPAYREALIRGGPYRFAPQPS